MFNISLNFDKSKNNIQLENNLNLEPEIEEFVKMERDYKTTLSGSSLELIQSFNEDVIIYLFIQKETESGAWNLVAPIVKGVKTNKIFQFGLGYFALQGSGGGLNNTDSLFYYSKKLKEKGYNIDIIPKVISNELISDFEYWDTELTLNDLDEKSLHLYNYSKGKFNSIICEYNRLNDKYFN